MKPKIVFFGSDQCSDIVYQALENSGRFEVVKALPAKTNNQEIIKQVKKFAPSVGVLASYGKILPREILAVPKHGILNIHPSLLPEFRGPAPVPMAILSGKTATGVSITKMDEQVDHGPILAQFKMEIYPEDTSQKLLEKCFTAGAQVLVTVLPSYLDGEIELRPQDHSKATFTPKLAKENGYLPLKILKNAIEGKTGKISRWPSKAVKNSGNLEKYHLATLTDRFIRAMTPWPGTFTKIKINHQTKRLKILKAHLENKKLILDKVQLESKNPVSFKQFCEGYPETELRRLFN